MKELEYQNYEKDNNGIIYSVDMIRVGFEIYTPDFEKLLNSDIGQDTKRRLSQVFESNASAKYKFIIKWSYPKDGNGVATIGYCYNDAKWEQRFAGFIEFNPNSFIDNQAFWTDYSVFKSKVKCLEVKRYDLAIDIPIIRDRIMVIKGNQKYSCEMYSRQNKTEYLGRRNKIGFTKIYNKQIEKGLSKPLTRVEVTCGTDDIKIPAVVDLSGIKGKDNAVLTSILTNDIPSLALATLSPYYQGIIRSEIEKNIICFDRDCINAINEQASKYIEK